MDGLVRAATSLLVSLYLHHDSSNNLLKIVSKILGGSAERLNAGCTSPAVRETASSVYHVVKGQGYSEINGQRFQWKQGDTFCVPAWNKYQHTAEGSETVYLYRFHDKPMLTSLGFYRVEGCDIESLVSD